MAEDHFEEVTIETDDLGRHLNVSNTRQVAERLTGNWPEAHKGALYRKAVKACMDHLWGKNGSDVVRRAFVEAAKEADILVREGRHSLTTTWTETRPGVFEVRLNANAIFLVRQDGARYDVQLPGLGWQKCRSRNQVERLCQDYFETSHPEPVHE